MDLYEGESKGRFEIFNRGSELELCREVVGNQFRVTLGRELGFSIVFDKFEDGSFGFKTSFPMMGAMYDKSGKLRSMVISIEDMMRSRKNYRKLFSAHDIRTMEKRMLSGESMMALIDLTDEKKPVYHVAGHEDNGKITDCILATPNGFYDGPVPGMDTQLRAYVGIENACLGLSKLDGTMRNFFFKRFLDGETVSQILGGREKLSIANLGRLLDMVSEDINMFKNGKK